MPLLGERSMRPWLRRVSVSVGALVCLLIVGCGSTYNAPAPPPPPPNPIGHVYFTTANSLLGYAIAASNGGLGAVTVPTTAPGGTAIASDGPGHHLYTLTSGGQIYGYGLNTSNGSLTSIAGSPFGGAGVGSAFLTIDAAGANLYVPAMQDLVVVPYTIGSGGALTIGLQVGTPATPLTATVDPPGHFLYVPMGSAGTELFQITAGALASVETILPQGQGKAVSIAITPADTFAYISDAVSGVAGYSVNATTGNLTPLAGSPFAAGTGPSAMVMTASGKFLYVANAVGLVSFAINADGSLTSIGSPITLGIAPLAVSIEPTGAYLYVISVNSTVVNIYQINSTTGLLTAQPSFGLTAVPTGIATTP